MKVKIDIDTRTFVRFWLVVIAFAALIGAIYLSRSALVLIGVALFLAFALNPPVTWLAKRLPGKSRVGATALAYLMVVTLLGTILFLVIPPIIAQTAKFADTIPSLIDKATSQKPLLDDFVQKYNLQGALNDAVASAKSQAAGLSKELGTILVGLVTGAFGWIANLFFVLVLSFFMLVEGPMWMQKIWGLYRDQEKMEAHKATAGRMYRVVTGFVNGQILVATTGATFTFITLIVMSFIPSLELSASLALPLAVIVFIMELIPMIGALLATLTTGLVLLLNSPVAALVFVIAYIIYQQVENNVIAPHIQSKNIELSVLWIIIALLIGSTMFGLVGALVSIPVAGSLRVLLVDYLEYAKKRREASDSKGLSKLLKRVSKET